MCHYHHLTLSERENLLFFRAQSYSISRIAAALGRDKSTISRELRRNTVNGKYLPITAPQQYARRRKACKPHKRLENAELFALVKNLFLVHHWSPEEIAGRLQLEHQKALLSYATIYRAIYAGMFDETSSSHWVPRCGPPLAASWKIPAYPAISGTTGFYSHLSRYFGTASRSR